jgi:hypothetical protein
MAGVRPAIERVYTSETPEELAQAGVDVLMAAARFEDAHTLAVGSDERYIDPARAWHDPLSDRHRGAGGLRLRIVKHADD